MLGLIFLRFADVRIEAAGERIESKAISRRKIRSGDYQAEGLVYLVPEARSGALLDLPEGSNLGKAVNDAMRMTEESNPDLKRHSAAQLHGYSQRHDRLAAPAHQQLHEGPRRRRLRPDL